MLLCNALVRSYYVQIFKRGWSDNHSITLCHSGRVESSITSVLSVSESLLFRSLPSYRSPASIENSYDKSAYFTLHGFLVHMALACR